MTNGTLGYEPRQGYTDSVPPFMVGGAKIKAFIKLHTDTWRMLREATDFTPGNTALYTQVGKLFHAVRQPYTPVETGAILGLIPPDRRKETCQWIAKLERAAAFSFASRPEDIDLKTFKLFGRDYDKQANNELAIFPLRHMPWKEKHRIMSIGAGPFPIGPIMMHQKTGKNITIVEPDKRVVDVGRDVLQFYNISTHAIRYQHAEMGMYGQENHPVAFFNNCEINNFQILSNIVEIRYQDNLVLRQGQGLYSTVYDSFSLDLAQGLNLKMSPRIAYGTSDTMQTSLFATIIKVPESIAKPGIGGDASGAQWAINKMLEDHNRPENRYLIHHLPS